MSELLRPDQLFNPLLASPHEPLTGFEVAAGPFGLLLFLWLIPLVRIAARRNRRAALIGFSLVWLVWTLGPVGATVLLAGVAAGGGWVIMLGAVRRSGRLGRRGMIALVWVGLHALILPAWWWPSAAWYGWQPTRLPLLHNIGFAYFLLRFIAWGCEWARQPAAALRLGDTICWILYPPCMRLGPLLRRETFLARYDEWNPAIPPQWREVARRCALFLVGGFFFAVAFRQLPRVETPGLDFFAAPQGYSTVQLLAVLYTVPVQVYLLLWCYNQVANVAAAWVGIHVDDNFNWLPLATSVRDFWRRWHTTVGAWVRDYIYVPLGGSRAPAWLTFTAVFGYIGIWHGASWSFVVWGLAQAAALVLERAWDQLRDAPAAAHRPVFEVWRARPVGAFLGWLVTTHFAIVTIVIFTDFEHLGVRFFAELVRRAQALF